MSITASHNLSPARTNKRHSVLKGLLFLFLAPSICLASCLGLYLFVEHVPHYLVPERPLLPGANSWFVIQQRFVQRGEDRVSIWQGEITLCEISADECADLSSAKVLEQVTRQYSEEDWEIIWSDRDRRSYACQNAALVNHKVDVVIKRSWLEDYVPTLCLGITDLGQTGFKIMITTINPTLFSSAWN